MLVTIISWFYIAFVCMVIGHAVLRMPHLSTTPGENGKANDMFRRHGITACVMAGMVAITVVSQYFSLIYKVGMVFHILMLTVVVGLFWLFRKDLMPLLQRLWRITLSWEGMFCFAVTVFFAYYASRGEFHFDTGLYHAQAIRWIEEYGVVTGLGNLQQNYAYNSAYLVFVSVFSMKWLTGISLHTTSGFLSLILALYALRGLKGVFSRQHHCADLCRVGALLYLLNTLYYLMSPATDYGVMIPIAYLIIRWVEIYEGKGVPDDYIPLCLMAAFTVTVKLSAATVVLIAVYPAYHLLRRKDWRRILSLIGIAAVIILPYLLRNIIISGWLAYPFTAIDWFNVDWKIPLDSAIAGSVEIIAGGRNIALTETDMAVREWVPIWWGRQQRYHVMLLYANVVALGLVFFNRIVKMATAKRVRVGDEPILAVYLAVLSSLGLWFFMSPSVRYGLILLLLLPALAIGEGITLIRENIKTPFRFVIGGMAALIFFSVSPYWDVEITYAGVFAKQQISAPYYIMPKDYEHYPASIVNKDGVDFFLVNNTPFVGYHNFPGTVDGNYLGRLMLRGENIRQGFRAGGAR